MTDDPKQVAEALSRLEAERDRRVLDKIARGDAVLLPPKVAVIGCPKPRAADAVAVERDTQGREIYYGTLREDGTIDPGISRIITGVPRAGRDEDGEPPAAQGAAMSARNSAGIWRCPTCRRTFPMKLGFIGAILLLPCRNFLHRSLYHRRQASRKRRGAIYGRRLAPRPRPSLLARLP